MERNSLLLVLEPFSTDGMADPGITISNWETARDGRTWVSNALPLAGTPVTAEYECRATSLVGVLSARIVFCAAWLVPVCVCVPVLRHAAGHARRLICEYGGGRREVLADRDVASPPPYSYNDR